MSKRLPLLVALLSLPLASVATEVARTPAESPKAAADETVVKKETLCPMVTGSRIRASAARGCESTKPLRSYSLEDMQRTGETNIIEALRKLDVIYR